MTTFWKSATRMEFLVGSGKLGIVDVALLLVLASRTCKRKEKEFFKKWERWDETRQAKTKKHSKGLVVVFILNHPFESPTMILLLIVWCIFFVCCWWGHNKRVWMETHVGCSTAGMVSIHKFIKKHICAFIILYLKLPLNLVQSAQIPCGKCKSTNVSI